MIGPSEPKSSTPISKRLTRRHFIESAIGAAVVAGVGASARAAAANEIFMMTATDLSAAIRNKKLSCREVMNAYLGHIDRVNPQFNAIVTRVDRETLLKQADSADTDLAKGVVHGWMHGFPHAVKDLAFTKGIRTTLGSPVFENFIPTFDAIFVERLKSNGAIIIGKTNTPELGLGSQTYNAIFGVTRNAYDPSKTAGGSSGGASVSLALRMQPVADGSDFAGSLRNPAGWNNIYGLRPSVGRVPFGPTAEVFMQSIGYEGPMARNPADLVMLLSVMAGYDRRTPLSLTEPASTFAAPLNRDVAGIRIGWLGDLNGIPMETGMLDFCLGALRRLESAGCKIEPATLGVSRDVIWKSFVTLRQGFLAGALAPLYKDPAKQSLFKPEAAWEIEGGMRLSAVDLYAASIQRSAVYQAFDRLFEQFDFLALPSAQVFPFSADVHWPKEVAGVAMDSYHRWMEIVAGPSLAGLPTIAVPAGFGPGGLPSGIQVIGPSQKDFSVIQLAHAYEQVSSQATARLPGALTK